MKRRKKRKARAKSQPHCIEVILRGDEVSGEYVTIWPAPLAVLGRIDTETYHLTTDRRGTSIRMETESVCPCQTLQRSDLAGGVRERDGVAVTFPGLREPAMLKMLEAGLDVNTNRRKTAVLPEPDLAGLGAFGAVDAKMLRFVRENDRGLIRYGAGVDPAVLCAEIALAYREAEVVIARATKRCVRRTGAVVQHLVPEARWRTRHGWDLLDRPRVITTLPGRLGYCMVAIHQRDILLAPDALQMLGTHNLEGLKRAFRAHVIGFLPMDAKLSQSEWDRLRCWYGFSECVVPAYGRTMLPVEVLLGRFKARRRADLNASPLMVKRQEIWEHPIRNRLLAKLAQQVRTGRRTSPDSPLNQFVRGPQRVAVLVESVGHAIELTRRLAGWPLLTAEQINTAGLKRWQVRALKDARRLLPAGDGVIVTHAAAEQLDFRQFDVVIRADGGLGLPPRLDQLTLEGGEVDQRRLLLIDMADRQHPVTRKWSASRREAYAQAGWHLPGANPMDERVHRFFQQKGGA